MTDEALLEVRDLTCEFRIRSRSVTVGRVQVVSQVSFEVRTRETLGIVGESGSGKSTLIKAILQIVKPVSGEVRFEGVDITKMNKRQFVELRRKMAVVFQDPFSALDPKWKVSDLIDEPMRLQAAHDRRSRHDTIVELLRSVGLNPAEVLDKRTRELSGGQCQRVAIARSLSAEPKLVILDEPVSALDVSVQAQVLNLLEDIKESRNLSYIFVGHNISVVKHISDRIAVMYLGVFCEIGPSEQVCHNPLHPYASALLKAMPETELSDGELDEATTESEPPSPLSPPSGCRYRLQCPRAQQRCADETPVLIERRPDHFAACHFPLESVNDAEPSGRFDEAALPQR